MNEHDFCREFLRDARWRAKEAGIELPKRITTNRSDMGGKSQFQIVHADDFTGPWVGKACCSYEAKAKWIIGLVDKKIEVQP